MYSDCIVEKRYDFSMEAKKVLFTATFLYYNECHVFVLEVMWNGY